jgi:L-asparaginase II
MLVDAAGKSLGVWGKEDFLVYPRSSIKALQATAFVSLGVQEDLKLSDAELSIACASHNGEKIHEDLVKNWLQKIQLSETDLECGAHIPYSEESYERLIRAGKKPCRIHNNCSGKHAGMLSGIQKLKLKTAGYSDYNHPYQQRVTKILEEFYGVKLGSAPWGIDGCGIPTIAVPLKNLALGMARFAETKKLSAEIQSSVAVIQKAIAKEPYMIGGKDSVCTEVITATKGEALVKVGAEGVYGAAFPKLGLGLALKAEDGNARAVEVVLAHFVKKLKVPFLKLGNKSLESYCQPALKNWAGEIVGELQIKAP